MTSISLISSILRSNDMIHEKSLRTPSHVTIKKGSCFRTSLPPSMKTEWWQPTRPCPAWRSRPLRLRNCTLVPYLYLQSFEGLMQSSLNLMSLLISVDFGSDPEWEQHTKQWLGNSWDGHNVQLPWRKWGCIKNVAGCRTMTLGQTGPHCPISRYFNWCMPKMVSLKQLCCPSTD